MAASLWRCPSSIRARAISPTSFPNCCSGLGRTRSCIGSDYGIWTPKWLIDKFMAFEIPADVTKETGRCLSMETKTKILGLNAARLYGIDVEAQKKKIEAGGGYAHLARSRPRATVIAMSGHAEQNERPRSRPRTGRPKSGHACKA